MIRTSNPHRQKSHLFVISVNAINVVRISQLIASKICLMTALRIRSRRRQSPPPVATRTEAHAYPFLYNKTAISNY